MIAISQTGIISTVAGTGSPAILGDGGAATIASIGATAGIIFDHSGNYYFSAGDVVRKVSPSGIISRVAGNGTTGFSGDGGPATAAQLHTPCFLAFSAHGDLYIGDVANNRIRKVNMSTGIITTVVGTGTPGFSGDGGAATAAKIYTPLGIIFDTIGNLYISDYSNERIRKVDTNGIIHTIAGTGTYVSGAAGDGGQATSAYIEIPWGLAFDRYSNLYVCSNGRVRKIAASTGIISAYAGDTLGGLRGDGGRADTAGLGMPVALAFDAIGNLFIGDMHNNDVRMVDTSWIIHTSAGNGYSGFSGDGGYSDTARLYSTRGVAVDQCGNLYINDNSNFRIRKVNLHPASTSAPSASIISSTSDTICAGTSVTFTVSFTGGGSITTYQWYVDTAIVIGATSSTYTYIPNIGDSI